MKQVKINKRNWTAGFVVASFLILSGCTQLEEQESPTTQTTQDTVPVQTTSNQLSNDYYRPLIVDGKYQSSQNRGVSLNLNSSINMKKIVLDITKQF